jgi:hypothetical protein
MQVRVRFALSVLTAVTLVTFPAFADVVTTWNSAALRTIRAERTSAPEASRALAILHLSIFDARQRHRAHTRELFGAERGAGKRLARCRGKWRSASRAADDLSATCGSVRSAARGNARGNST